MDQITEFNHLKIKLEDIKLATNDFANESCIGGGGFGKVYKGVIDHSKGRQTMVAFKRLDRKFGQGDPEFWKEVMMLSFYKHENIVSLVGYCDDFGEKILIYEYATKRSLDLYLRNDELTWVQRLKICIGVARGLTYLHTPIGSQLRVLHRDIKSSNILLDDNWNAKIADFGLSKFGPTNQPFTFLVSSAVGTYGYCDPLYIESGLLTKESDVYSFGVVLFEVLCGRLCIGNINDKQQRPLIGLVREYFEENNINELTYVDIKGEIEPHSLKEFTEIAYQCIHRERKQRPLMAHIVGKLEQSLVYQEAKAKAERDAKAHTKGKADTEVIPEAKAKAVAMAKGSGILIVKVMRITAVEESKKSTELFSAANPYLILCLLSCTGKLKNKLKTSVKHDEQNPEWNEELNLYVENFYEETLDIQVISMISAKFHHYLGHANLIFRSLTPEIPKTFDCDVKDESDHNIGKFMIELVYKPFTYDQILSNIEDLSALQKAPIGTPQGGGLLVVIIHRAFFYAQKGLTFASVSLLFRGQLMETPIMSNSFNPVWEHEFKFMLKQPPRKEEKLHFEIINNNKDDTRGLINGGLGSADITIADVVKMKRVTHSCKIRENGVYSNWLDVELQWRTSD